MLVLALDTTQIVIAAIGAFVSIVNGFGIVVVLSHIRTPSGDKIGRVAERTEHMSSAGLAHTTALVKAMNGETHAKDETGGETA